MRAWCTVQQQTTYHSFNIVNIEKSLQFNRLWNVKYEQTFELLLKKVQKRINLSWQGSQESDDLSTYKTDFMSAANYSVWKEFWATDRGA